MDRSWLLLMPPKGLSSFARRTRVGRLRHEGDLLWMDLQAGRVQIDLGSPVEVMWGRWDDGGHVWVGVELRQSTARLSIQARVQPEDVPDGAVAMDLDGPAIGWRGLQAVQKLLLDG
jgi:hypothetical protein